MALLKIITYGDPILRRQTALVKSIDKELITLIHNMFETMYMAPGVGLSANQVGVPLNLCVIDVKPNGISNPLVLINPHVQTKHGRIFGEEGCLSLPGIFIKVPRFRKVIVSAINAKGMPIEITGEGLLARALQHELDHLAGRLLIDRVGIFTKLKIQKQINLLKKKGQWK